MEYTSYYIRKEIDCNVELCDDYASGHVSESGKRRRPYGDRIPDHAKSALISLDGQSLHILIGGR